MQGEKRGEKRTFVYLERVIAVFDREYKNGGIGMNRIFKVIYSKTKHMYVVASELAKSHGKSKNRGVTSGKILTALVVAALTSVSFMAAPMTAEASTETEGWSFIGIKHDSSEESKASDNYKGAGSIGDNSITIGENAKAGDGTIAIGDRRADVSKASVYVGQGDIAKPKTDTGAWVTSVGYNSDATGYGSIAIGSNAVAKNSYDKDASGNNIQYSQTYKDTSGKTQIALNADPGIQRASVALGYGASADNGNIAIGSYSDASTDLRTNSTKAYKTDTKADSYVSVGTSTALRRVSNVADGAADTDVATIAQLKKVAESSTAYTAGWGIDISTKDSKNTISLKRDLGTDSKTDEADLETNKALILGGNNNAASGEYSVVVAGNGNQAKAKQSSVTGGQSNTASGELSSVSGGKDNVASASWSSVSGGANNTASMGSASVSGGEKNTASGGISSVSGGYLNTASGYDSSILGGGTNTASGKYSTVSGGYNNKAAALDNNSYSSVAGGEYNVAIGNASFAAGGSSSWVAGEDSTGIGGGSTGRDASYSVAIGSQSIVTADHGMAIGYQAAGTEKGTIAFGHDKNDVSGYGVQVAMYTDPTSQTKKYATAAQVKAGTNITWEDTGPAYSRYVTDLASGGQFKYTEKKSSSAYYNRLVKVADGIDDHDVVVMEQLKPYTKVDASNIGANLNYKSDGTTVTDGDKITNENAWGDAIGTGKIADLKASDGSTNGSQQLVTGGTVYTEVRPENGSYVKKANTTAENLTALDKQLADMDGSAVKYDTRTENGKTVVDKTKVTLGDGTGDTTITHVKSAMDGATDKDGKATTDITAVTGDSLKNAVNLGDLQNAYTTLDKKAGAHTALTVEGKAAGTTDTKGNAVYSGGSLLLHESTDAETGKVTYDLKLADKISLGTSDDDKIVIDGGNASTIKVGKNIRLDGKNGKAYIGGVTIAHLSQGELTYVDKDGKPVTGTTVAEGNYAYGLTNTSWSVDNPNYVKGRAATEDELLTVSEAAKEAKTGLDTKANMDASNIGTNLKGSDGKTAATTDEQNTNENLWGKAIGTGKVADPDASDKEKNGSQQLVTGGTVYTETHAAKTDSNGQAVKYDYIDADATAGENFAKLDSAMKTMDTKAGAHTALTVEGGTPANGEKDQYAGKNIQLHSDTNTTTGKVTYDVKLAKDLTGITSISNQTTSGDKTTGAKITLGTDGKTTISGGDVDVSGNRVTDLKDGDLSAKSTDAVTGKQLYKEQQDRINAIGTLGKETYNYIDKTASVSDNLDKLDTQVKTNADNISSITQKFNTLDGDAVKYDKDSNKGKVTLAGKDGTTIDKVKDGTINSTSKEAVNGSQLYTEQEARKAEDTRISNKIGSLDKDGNYIKRDDSISKNLSTLDGQVKTNADAISQETKDREAADKVINDKIGSLDKDGNYIKKDASISTNLNTLDGQVKTNADHIADNTKAINEIKTTVNNLSDNAVQYDKNSNKSKITLTGQDGTTITNVKDGSVVKDSKDAVNGGQLYDEKNAREKADTEIRTDITKIKDGEGFTDKGKTVIKSLAQDAVDVIGGDNVTVTSDTQNDKKTFTVNVDGNGKVASNDKGLISGDIIYKELRPENDGSYIRKNSTTAENLTNLDTQVKKTADLINSDGKTIKIGGSDAATKIDVSGKDSGGSSTARIITGVQTDADDPTSAANVGYVNEVSAASTQQIYRDMNSAYGHLNNNINKAAAGSNALAALHPLDYDPGDKASYAVGYGHYRNANAAAVGAFYQPNENTMVSVGVSMGNGDPGVNAGVSFKVGKGSTFNGVSKAQMAETIAAQEKQISEIKASDVAKDKRIDSREKENQEMKKQIQEILAKLGQ